MGTLPSFLEEAPGRSPPPWGTHSGSPPLSSILNKQEPLSHCPVPAPPFLHFPALIYSPSFDLGDSPPRPFLLYRSDRSFGHRPHSPGKRALFKVALRLCPPPPSPSSCLRPGSAQPGTPSFQKVPAPSFQDASLRGSPPPPTSFLALRPRPVPRCWGTSGGGLGPPPVCTFSGPLVLPQDRHYQGCAGDSKLTPSSGQTFLQAHRSTCPPGIPWTSLGISNAAPLKQSPYFPSRAPLSSVLRPSCSLLLVTTMASHLVLRGRHVGLGLHFSFSCLHSQPAMRSISLSTKHF